MTLNNKSKKTILYLVTQSELGGAQTYVFDLVTSLQLEYNVVIGSGEQGHKGELAKMLKETNTDFYTVPYLQRKISPWHDFMALFQIIKLIKKIKPDIIHLNSSKISILGSLAVGIIRGYSFKNSRPIRVIYTVHGWVFNEPMSSLKRLFYQYAEKITALFKDKLICVSQFDYDLACQYKIAPQRKLVMIHNGIKEVKFLSREEARVKLNVDNEKFVIGSIGNLYKNKGFKYLIEATKELVANNSQLTTIIIGEGQGRNNLEKLIKEYNLENNIILAGRIENASELLLAFDIYVCSSVKEGLSYTIIEAMQSGLPIVATNVGGNPELIKDQETGFLIKPNDPGILASKINEIINNPDLMQEQSTKARIKALEEFNLETMIKKTKAVYLD